MAGGKIFISYRRADSQWAAARLYDALTAAFPDERIFMDVEKIAPGQDFVEVLEGQVGACDVFLALIGPEWFTLQSPGGGRRIEDAQDFVRIEIASALARAETVTIPVLIDGASLPAPAELPEGLAPLARRQFVRLTHEGYRGDFGLHDMAGNLAEWVEDVYRNDVENNPTDGSARRWESADPMARRHVLKGGSFRDRPWMVRPAMRVSNDRNWRSKDYGFRLARDMRPR